MIAGWEVIARATVEFILVITVLLVYLEWYFREREVNRGTLMLYLGCAAITLTTITIMAVYLDFAFLCVISVCICSLLLLV